MVTSNQFLNILLLVIGYFMFVTYNSFLMDIAIAFLMVISLAKLEMFFFDRFKNKYVSSTLVTLIFSFFLILPILYFIFEVAGVLGNISMETIQTTTEKAKVVLTYLPEFVQDKIASFISINNIESSYNTIMLYAGKLTASSAIFLKDTILIIIFFFFTNLYAREFLSFVQNIIPLEERQSRMLFDETSQVMNLVFYSVSLTAILEGLLFGFIVYMYGFSPLFWIIMYAFASLIPIVGGAIMWVPLTLYLYAKGDTTGAFGIAIYSIVVISIIADTFIKPLIIEKLKGLLNTTVELNSLLIFFSIIAGLGSFGFWGMLIGPAITTLFLSILKFYKKAT
jgi:predicted PurR-regulated permease PerM